MAAGTAAAVAYCEALQNQIDRVYYLLFEFAYECFLLVPFVAADVGHLLLAVDAYLKTPP